ncbi:MAG: hypothetical protein HYV35_04080 [Lentisphaerae bacterium]|nr:hypothetical protein [Lentisphaerota bacterium]
MPLAWQAQVYHAQRVARERTAMPYRTFSLNEAAGYLHLARAEEEVVRRMSDLTFHAKRAKFGKL